MKKLSLPSAYTIAFAFVIIAAILTWVLPAGSYNYKVPGTDHVIQAAHVASYKGDVRLMPIPGTYTELPSNHQGLISILQTPVLGFYNSIEVIFYLLAIGGFLGIITKTGALDASITRLIVKLKGKENALIICLTTVFALGGVTFGLCEETFAFFPLLIPIMLTAGYDVFTSVLIILLGSGIGTMCAIVNPFGIGIASKFMGISIGDGIVTRSIYFAICLIFALFVILRYANKVKKDPARSIIADKKEELEEHFLRKNSSAEIPEFTTKRKITITLFILTFVVYVYAVIPFDSIGLTFLPSLDWSFTQMSTWFGTCAVIIGLIYGLKEEEIIGSFLDGAKDFLGVGIIIGISRGISVLMAKGLIIDTVLNYSVHMISHLSSYTSLTFIYFIHVILSFFIISSSGLATITMPILEPLCTFIHLPKDLVITAYSAASGIVNLFAPTAALVMGSIIIGKVPYTRFLRFIFPKIIIFFIITIVVLCGSLYINMHLT